MIENVNEIISKKIDNIINQNNFNYYGKVIMINDFSVEVSGLNDAFYFEKVYINNEENIGYVDKIEKNKIIVSIIRSNGNISIGDSVISTKSILEGYFSEYSMGMIVDLFGNDRLSNRQVNNVKSIPIYPEKIGIMERTTVNRPLLTGIAAIDLLFPIGKGQRQLIIGDKKTGKTQICLDTISNLKNKNMICIYVAIGKTKKEIKDLYSTLLQRGALDYTIIVAAFNDDTAPFIKLTPYAAMSIANEFLKEGKDVLVCIDDLKRHADVCREIALISEKSTGRDAYPSDIFYTHSRLLEMGCQHQNGGSITVLPIVETNADDISDYISTNIISITDGQTVLSSKMFAEGQKPAINFGLSVSRLGSQVQDSSIKAMATYIKRELLSYLETSSVYQLVNIESMSSELQNKILRGKKTMDLMKQPKFSPFDLEQLIERFAFLYDDNKNSDIQSKDDNDTNLSDLTPKDENLSEDDTTENIEVSIDEISDDESLTNDYDSQFNQSMLQEVPLNEETSKDNLLEDTTVNVDEVPSEGNLVNYNDEDDDPKFSDIPIKDEETADESLQENTAISMDEASNEESTDIDYNNDYNNSMLQEEPLNEETSKDNLLEDTIVNVDEVPSEGNLVNYNDEDDDPEFSYIDYNNDYNSSMLQEVPLNEETSKDNLLEDTTVNITEVPSEESVANYNEDYNEPDFSDIPVVNEPTSENETISLMPSEEYTIAKPDEELEAIDFSEEAKDER